MGLFDWFRKNTESTAKTKEIARRPAVRDFTNRLVANSDLTKGIYRNTYPGFKLAGSLVYPMINHPVFFMGVPSFMIPGDDNDQINQDIMDLVEKMTVAMKNIHIQSHRDGTVWVWPRYNSKLMKIEWEFIPDKSVSDVITDIHTGEIIRLYTDELISVSTRYNNIENVRRIREYTRTKITTTYPERAPGVKLDDRTVRNVIGILPINFSNDADSDEIRGHSDIERIISILKMYHDVSLAEAQDVATFRTKQVQTVVKDAEEWLKAQGSSLDEFANGDFDIAKNDFVINKGEEKTDFVIPDRVVDGPEKVLKRLFRQIVEASALPEIIWGVKTEGNANTAEEQMLTLLQYVQDKRVRKKAKYLELITASLRLLSIVNGSGQSFDGLKIKWNSLDNVSDKTKSEIFRNFAQGLSAVMNVASLSKKQLYNLWKMQYPDSTTEDFEEFKTAISDMASFRQFTNASYMDALEAGGIENN